MQRIIRVGLLLALTFPGLVMAASYPRGATPLPVAKPESQGMSTERLERMGAFFQGEVAKETAAGYVIVVARNGKLLYSTAVGERDREQQHQQDREPEIRHGDADLGRGHDAVVADGVVLGGGVDAESQGDDRGQRHGDESERQGQHQALADQL